MQAPESQSTSKLAAGICDSGAIRTFRLRARVAGNHLLSSVVLPKSPVSMSGSPRALP
jgi:hypothetical protein